MEFQLRQRMAELRAEYDKGQQTLMDLERQAENLRQTLLRISGAVQVLQELLDEPQGADGGKAAPPA
ncbi:hypothetical protein [Azohydromonas aeria]|uniref:hypothetical protein n=1 Tax=Azohydromonas aeria TaxID=2590212 RepID=UPI0012FB54A5|nr:hypothetical protein [Azohydromonas aeria]